MQVQLNTDFHSKNIYLPSTNHIVIFRCGRYEAVRDLPLLQFVLQRDGNTQGTSLLLAGRFVQVLLLPLFRLSEEVSDKSGNERQSYEMWITLVCCKSLVVRINGSNWSSQSLHSNAYRQAIDMHQISPMHIVKILLYHTYVLIYV